mgnify:CR=1 FL=1
MGHKSLTFFNRSLGHSVMTPGALHDESGGVSLLVLCITFGLLSVLCVCAGFAQVTSQIRKTESAADLSALAGAQHLLAASDEACATARIVAELNASELEQCEVSADSVSVVVGQSNETLLLQKFLPVIHATARAGF